MSSNTSSNPQWTPPPPPNTHTHWRGEQDSLDKNGDGFAHSSCILHRPFRVVPKTDIHHTTLSIGGERTEFKKDCAESLCTGTHTRGSCAHSHKHHSRKEVQSGVVDPLPQQSPLQGAVDQVLVLENCHSKVQQPVEWGRGGGELFSAWT